jgi:hypothetical protein
VRWESTSLRCTASEPPKAAPNAPSSTTTKAAKDVFDAAEALAAAASFADWTALSRVFLNFRQHFLVSDVKRELTQALCFSAQFRRRGHDPLLDRSFHLR